MIDYSLCEVRNMNIEIGGISIIKTVIESATNGNVVDLKKPITHTVTDGLYDFTTTVFPRAFRRPQECRILNGLIRFPLPPRIEGTN